MRKLLAVLFLFPLFLTATSAFAISSPELVKNYYEYGLRTTSEMAVYNGKVYLTYDDGITGSELWVISSPGAAPTLLKDINPGAADSNPNELFVAGGKLLFAADDGVHGSELWESDGTPAGTKLVADFYTGPNSSFPTNFERYDGGDAVAFQANLQTVGRVFCTMTSVITECRSDLKTSFSGNYAVEHDGNLYFAANDSVNGQELWKRDIATGAYSLVADINASGPNRGSDPKELFVIPGKGIVFSATDGVSGVELWFSDGSTAVRICDIKLGADSSSPSDFALINNGIVFAATDSSSGREPWISDLTLNGCQRIQDIVPGSGSSNPREFQAYGNGGATAYFAATNDVNGEELWVTDGSGAVLVKDINPGADDGYPYSFFTFNNNLYFIAYNPQTGEELYLSDGTESGTGLLDDLRPGSPASYPYYFDTLSNRLVFLGYGEKSQEVFFTNTAGDTVTQSSSLLGPGDESSDPGNLTRISDTLLFLSAENAEYGIEPHVLNTITQEITLLKDLQPGANDSFPTVIGVLSGKVIFTASNSTSGRELWITDGTPSGTQLVKDINPGSDSSSPARLALSIPMILNGYLYFAATSPSEGVELWRTDGTTGGTTLVRDINPGSDSSNPSGAVIANGMIMFAADDGANGRELWKSDGTFVGTTLVKNIDPFSNSNPNWLVSHDGLVFFQAEGQISVGAELWKSDGTEAGTQLVLDILPGAGDGYPSHLYSFQGDLFFSAYKATNHQALYRVGAPYGPSDVQLVKDTDSGTPTGVSVGNFAELSGKLFFLASTPGEGEELWS
ncbi:MAG: hypothetical protein KDD60_06075, partial [Bdellovibrionales bacterium]|nr:hypothetical protein [Bdellovibrionales bacterium]